MTVSKKVKAYFNWKLVFILIVIISLALRLVFLSSIPPSLHADEADAGYSAYSIGKTLQDQYGNFLPLSFQDNHRAPLFIYVLIPSVFIFGLDAFAVRLPSALFGTLTVILLFYLTYYLFKDRRISLLASFLAGINPWLIQLSRTGLEESLSLFLVLAGIVSFLYASNKRWYLYFISCLALTLSLFSYHAPKIFLPLFLPVLFMYKIRDGSILSKEKKYLIYFVVIFVIFYAVSFGMLMANGAEKFNDTSIFSSAKIKQSIDSERHLSVAPLGLSSIFHNKVTYSIKRLETQFFGVFSLNYLFINGESNLDKGVGNHGQFYIFELPLFFIGLYFIFKKKKIFVLLFFWLLAGAFPGGLTNTGYYAYRDLLLIPVFIMASSVAVICVFDLIRKDNRMYKIILGVSVLLALVYITSYLFTYFFDYPVYSRDWWGYGQKEGLRYAVINQGKYNKIFVDGGLDWPILYAFYNKIDPEKFQNSFETKVYFNNNEYIKIDKFYFGNIEKSATMSASEILGRNVMYIGQVSSFPNITPIYRIFSPDGVNVNDNILIIK
ncbi:MAG TPA: glycosyltransferase family 39 protein [Patescibacteria group bacterium]|nr:glycosyltransferase family 39 protein [Patescibacteria group bacterium]